MVVKGGNLGMDLFCYENLTMFNPDLCCECPGSRQEGCYGGVAAFAPWTKFKPVRGGGYG